MSEKPENPYAFPTTPSYNEYGVDMQHTQEWHEQRKLGIGGSDCAAALGLSKWKTPYQLYLEKIGEAAPLDDNWNMARGRALEPMLRQHYADNKGVDVVVPNNAIVSEKHSFMRYNPDGIANGRLIEFKTASYGKDWGEPNTDQIPAEYALQVQHGMVVTGLPVTDITVSIGAQEPKYYIVEADKELQGMIIESEARFWEMVINRKPPMPSTNENVAKVYNKITGKTIEANFNIIEDVTQLEHIKEQIKKLERDQEQLEVAIKNYMQGNETLLINGVPKITWKQQAGVKRLDTDRLKKEQPQIAAQYIKESEPTRRFLIK